MYRNSEAKRGSENNQARTTAVGVGLIEDFSDSRSFYVVFQYRQF